MILNLEDTSPQARYIPDVYGYNFSLLMPDTFSAKAVRSSVRNSAFGLSGLGVAWSFSATNLRTGRSSSGTADDYGPVMLPGDRLQLSASGLPPGAVIDAWFSWPGAPVLMSGMRDAAGDLIGWRTGQTADSSGNWSWQTTITKDMAGFWGAHFNIGGQILGAATWQVDGGLGTGEYGIQLAPEKQLDAGTPYYQQMGVQPSITGQVPTATVQTLEQQLAARGETLASSGQLVPVTKPNQSVPPKTQITQIPTLPTAPSTRQVLTSAYYGSGVPAPTAPASSQLIAGIDNQTLALGAAALVGLLMVLKK